MSIVKKLNELAKASLTKENVNTIVGEFNDLYNELIYVEDKDLDLDAYFADGNTAEFIMEVDDKYKLLSHINTDNYYNEYYIVFNSPFTVIADSFIVAVKDDLKLTKQLLLDISKEANMVFNQNIN